MQLLGNLCKLSVEPRLLRLQLLLQVANLPPPLVSLLTMLFNVHNFFTADYIQLCLQQVPFIGQTLQLFSQLCHILVNGAQRLFVLRRRASKACEVLLHSFILLGILVV